MKYRPKLRLPLNGLLSMIILAACSVGDLTSPAPQLSGALQQQLLPNGEVAQVALDVAPADTQFKTFTIDDDVSAWYSFGNHKLYVPKNAICDLNSGYGPTYWLQACASKTNNTTVTAKYWTDSRGYARAEFRPDLRFKPDKPAWLYLKDPKGALATSSAILYCQDGTDICYNESLNDPAMQTNRDPVTGWVWRIIRHFSGYNVWA